METQTRSPGFRSCAGRFVAGPGKIGGREHGVIRADLDGGEGRLDGGDQAGDVIAFLDRAAPIVILIFVERAKIILQNVGQVAAPAVTAVVGVQAVAHGLVGGFLHGDVQRGVDAQALFVDRGGAVGVLEILANVFDEVRREIVSSVRKCAGRAALSRGGCLRGADFAVVRHQGKNEIASRQGALGMRDRRIDRPANDGGERGGLGEGQLPDGLAEIIFRRRFETVVSGAEINLIAVHRENLIFGVVALDLQGENRFLNFAVEAAVGAIKKEAAGELHGQGAGAFGDAMAGDIT